MGKKSKKSQGDEAPRVILGRPGNNVKIAIVGLPNVGKSTLFNVLSGLGVAAENYPFCTIDPAKAQIPVPDERWEFLCEFHQPQKRVGAVLSCWDVAGLVRGAHEGHGLGNEFLSNIASCDAIYHCIRAFSAKNIEHVDGDVNPIRDLETISGELRHKDIAIVAAYHEKRSALAVRTNDKQQKWEAATAAKILGLLEGGGDVRLSEWTAPEVELINTFNLFTAKPVVYLVNVSKKGWCGKGSKWLKPIKKWVKKNSPGSKVVPFSAKFETEYAACETPEEKAAYLADHSTEEQAIPSQVSKIVWAGYKSLQLIHYFTCGPDEVKCWTIKKGTLAPQAAGVIHSDFEQGFICAETMAYKDFVEYGTENAVKAAGKYKQNGRNYVVNDGDIMFFKFNN